MEILEYILYGITILVGLSLVYFYIWIEGDVNFLSARRDKPVITNEGTQTDCKSSFANCVVKATSHSLEVNLDVPDMVTRNNLEVSGYVSIDGGEWSKE